MPATLSSTGTEQFLSFEEKRYQIRVVSCQETTSPPPDNRPQYKWEVALEGTEDPMNGGELVRRMWTSQIWNDTPGKESHLVIVARALCGPQVTQEAFEQLDYPDLVGLRGSVMVKLDAKGWPSIDKETFKPIAAARQLQAPARPAAQPAPVAQAEALADPRQIKLLHLAAEAAEVDAGRLAEYIATKFGGKTEAMLTAAEAKAVLTDIQNGEIAPF